MTGIAASLMLAGLIGYLAGANTTSQTPDTLATDRLATKAPTNNVSTTNAVAGNGTSPDASVLTDTPSHSTNFARNVAAYQKFYVRETLKGAVPLNPVKVSERLANQTDMEVIIPELEGYEFMRAQRLSVDGELLLQLVYLGAEGGPLALCYIATPESKGETATTLQQHHGLNTVEWRHNGHRFVIVSDAPGEKLEQLSQSTRQQWSI